MNGLDPFERSIKSSLEQFEVPYNSADWAQMDKQLNGAGSGSWLGTTGFYAALLAGMLAVGSGAWYLTRPEAPELAQSEEAGMQPTTGSSSSMTALPPTTEGAQAGQERGTGTVTTPDDAAAGTEISGPNASSVTEKATAGSTTEDGKATSAPKSTKPAEEPSTGKKGAFVASISEGCEGTAVEFNVQNMPEEGIYLWNFGDGYFSNKPNPNHTFSKPGRFTVTLSMSAPGKGAITNEPYEDMIVIHEVPEASFNWIRQEYAGHVPSVHFENRSHGGTTYAWEFGDGATSTVAHPDHVYRSKGEYQVRLTVRNEMGCEDIIEKVVRIDNDYNLLAPASFSPNHDGNEDQWMPQALKELGVKFHLAIYEPKTGRLVYETSDASKHWNGSPMNRGEVCKPGEYVWMVEIHEGLHLGEIQYEGKPAGYTPGSGCNGDD